MCLKSIGIIINHKVNIILWVNCLNFNSYVNSCEFVFNSISSMPISIYLFPNVSFRIVRLLFLCICVLIACSVYFCSVLTS